MLAHLQNVALLRINSTKTAEWASKLLGDYEAYRTQVSRQTGPDGTVTESETEILEVRKALLGSELQSLQVASEYDGYRGLYVSEVGAWWQHMQPATLAMRLGQPDLNVEAYMPRTVRLRLKPWDEADLIRLGLPLSLLVEQQEAERALFALLGEGGVDPSLLSDDAGGVEEHQNHPAAKPVLYAAKLRKPPIEKPEPAKEEPAKKKERRPGLRSGRLRSPKSQDREA
jgi:hypothetical protein